mgnify:CR=1 FL=1
MDEYDDNVGPIASGSGRGEWGERVAILIVSHILHCFDPVLAVSAPLSSPTHGDTPRMTHVSRNKKKNCDVECAGGKKSLLRTNTNKGYFSESQIWN